jgi:Zn-dependent peptidase ImmA (M78 family)/transcriptional regulator with XRE-family HTH domain
MLEKTSKKLIGNRVKAARDAKGWKQEDLTKALGLKDRQTISDIENGKRALKSDEMLTLSDILGCDIDFFIDPFAVVGEAQFSWRADLKVPEDKLSQFELKAGKWIGLLRWLREQQADKVNPLKSSLRLSEQSLFEEAIARAESLVVSFDLGGVPAVRLIDCLERVLDIPVLFVDTIKSQNGEGISGAACHLPDLGVILVNRNEPEGRRNFDMAHELFHVLTWDTMKPEHRESDSSEERGKRKRIEQLADNFAAALLMPVASLDQLIDQRRANDVEHLAEVAAELRVSPAALAWRLYNIKRINDDTLNALKQLQQRDSITGTPKRFSLNFVVMLHKAIDRGELSARKAAKAMDMSLPQLGELFVEHSLLAPFEL